MRLCETLFRASLMQIWYMAASVTASYGARNVAISASSSCSALLTMYTEILRTGGTDWNIWIKHGIRDNKLNYIELSFNIIAFLRRHGWPDFWSSSEYIETLTVTVWNSRRLLPFTSVIPGPLRVQWRTTTTGFNWTKTVIIIRRSGFTVYR